MTQELGMEVEGGGSIPWCSCRLPSPHSAQPQQHLTHLGQVHLVFAAQLIQGQLVVVLQTEKE